MEIKMEIINKILEWPVIVQGMVGSFLFWAIFTIGQKIIEISTKKIKEDKKLGHSWGKSARNDFYTGNYLSSNYSFFICIYGAIHYFLKFVIVIFISLILKDFVPVFSYVGYTIAFYYIFRSISYVTHFSAFEAEDRKNGKKHPREENDVKNIQDAEIE